MLEQIISINDDSFLAELFGNQSEDLVEFLEANLTRLEVVPTYVRNVQYVCTINCSQ